MTRTARRLAVACAAVAALATVGTAAPQAGAGKPAAPAFRTYHEPGVDPGEGEPTIGVDWRTGTALYQSGLRTLAVTWDRRGTARWEERSGEMTSLFSLDPILYTDAPTGRTWVSQLVGDCSLLAYSDDDGRTWQNSTGCGPGAYIDHQTVAAGPYPQDRPLVTFGSAPYAVYYCAQAYAEASCARSDDGGVTFGPAVPMYTLAQCEGLHGHLRVAPDGTAYVPHQGCGTSQALVVSEDSGATWSIRKAPGSSVNLESDPAVGTGSDGTVYFGYQDGPGSANTRAMVATTRDHGKTWSAPVDVSSRLGIRNVQFPQMVAGDGDRAAIAFLGTKTGGDDQQASFDGVWHLYVSVTYDRGRTWKTVDATPNESVQRGCIQMTGCRGHRNLLDFNGIAVDKQGRVLVAWADGCPVVCERGAPYSESWHTAVISRQSAGRGLFKAYDATIR